MSSIGGIGFRIIPLPDLTHYFLKYDEWLASGFHGDMDYLVRGKEKRRYFPEWANSILVCRSFYNDFSWGDVDFEACGLIAKYAVRDDYHITLKMKIYEILLEIEPKAESLRYKIFVDSSPVLEKPVGYFAGFGFIGSNTLVVDFEWGSYFNIGGAFLSVSNCEPSSPVTAEACVDCNLCVKACPTKALIQPGLLDARRCISYLTIEYKGVINVDKARGMGNWIFGCDLCQEICPLNKRLSDQNLISYARAHLIAPPLDFLVSLDEKEFYKLFSGTPVSRVGYVRFMRNVLVAAFNTGDSNIFSTICFKLKELKIPLLENQIKELEESFYG
ncbi:MAG TPA: tRNA epoxyqueuosine(34) reductase QueG [Candidatus Hydrothermia bacterium]|nr:tRNA epoxyqueuosine(34) reductase QueG [Candidatus Hydrothermia bacterium]